AYVAKLNATGTSLIWGGFIGGTFSDRGYGIAVDDAGAAYVTGETASNADAPAGGQGLPNGNGASSPSPVRGFRQTVNGSSTTNAFVAKLSGTDGALQYWTYIGGTGTDCGTRGLSIAVDATHRAYVAGDTCSTEASFPNGSGIGSLSPSVVGFDQTYNTP